MLNDDNPLLAHFERPDLSVCKTETFNVSPDISNVFILIVPKRVLQKNIRTINNPEKSDFALIKRVDKMDTNSAFITTVINVRNRHPKTDALCINGVNETRDSETEVIGTPTGMADETKNSPNVNIAE